MGLARRSCGRSSKWPSRLKRARLCCSAIAAIDCVHFRDGAVKCGIFHPRAGQLVETALIKTEVFSIINTADISEVLKAQEISLSDCTDESCAIQIGKLLSAEQIVIGDLSAVGARMALNLRLLDVSSGEVLRAEVADVASVEELQKMTFVAA
jgi:curli biogenesis system outer membrane secretion channel CsgG